MSASESLFFTGASICALLAIFEVLMISRLMKLIEAWQVTKNEFAKAAQELAKIKQESREVSFGGEYRVNDQGEIVLMPK